MSPPSGRPRLLTAPRASFVCHGLHAATPLESRHQDAECIVLDPLRNGNRVGCGLVGVGVDRLDGARVLPAVVAEQADEEVVVGCVGLGDGGGVLVRRLVFVVSLTVVSPLFPAFPLRTLTFPFFFPRIWLWL